MRRTRASRTAEAVCFCRALDQHQAPEARLIDDPYASWFLSPVAKAALATVGATGRVGRWAEQLVGERAPALEGLPWRASLAPPLATYILLRHRFIDDAMQAGLTAGVEQVLVLGAGYDARAFRFADQLAGRPVYELDFPSTSRRKEELLRAHAHQLPDVNVTRLQVDFQNERLADALARTDFQPGRPTFVVWEGVSMYLPRATVQDTLSQLRGLVGPSSELAWDLWYLLDAPDLVATAHRVTPNLLHLFGEPIVFGMHPEDLPDFLRRAGLESLEIADVAGLRARYLTDDHRSVYPAVYLSRVGLSPAPGHPRRTNA